MKKYIVIFLTLILLLTLSLSAVNAQDSTHLDTTNTTSLQYDIQDDDSQSRDESKVAPSSPIESTYPYSPYSLEWRFGIPMMSGAFCGHGC